jgi:hypothetical protein
MGKITMEMFEARERKLIIEGVELTFKVAPTTATPYWLIHPQELKMIVNFLEDEAEAVFMDDDEMTRLVENNENQEFIRRLNLSKELINYMQRLNVHSMLKKALVDAELEKVVEDASGGFLKNENLN